MPGPPSPFRKLRLLSLGAGLFVLSLGLFLAWLHVRSAENELLRTDLETAVTIGTPEEVKGLLDRGMDPNMRSFREEEKVGFVEWLKGLFVGRKRDVVVGQTLLEMAMNNERHRYGVAKLLLERGARIHPAPPPDEPPLLWAARSGDLATSRLLVEHGSDVNESSFGFTPLMGACLAAEPDVVRYLLQKGARVTGNERTEIGFGEPPPPKDKDREIREMLAEAKVKQAKGP